MQSHGLAGQGTDQEARGRTGQPDLATSRPDAQILLLCEQETTRSFGCSAANSRKDCLGRLDGSGTTRPAWARYRLILAAETVRWW